LALSSGTDKDFSAVAAAGTTAASVRARVDSAKRRRQLLHRRQKASAVAGRRFLICIDALLPLPPRSQTHDVNLHKNAQRPRDDDEVAANPFSPILSHEIESTCILAVLGKKRKSKARFKIDQT